MPPEDTKPVAKTESSEFEFEAQQPDSNPRLKKRNLKAAAQAAGANVARPATEPARPAVYAQPAAATHSTPADQRPAYARPSGTDQRPQPAPATGVLYYSNSGTSARRPEAMKAPLSPAQATRLASGAAQAAANSLPQRTAASAQATSQQRTSSAATQPRPASSYSQRPASTQQAAPTRPVSTTHTPVSQSTHPTSHSTHASSAARPTSGASTSRPASSAAAAAAATQQVSRAVSTTVASPGTSSRPAGVSDYRANIERQSREQKSVGNLLSILVYGVVAVLLCGGVLAAYGAHDVYKQLHAQSTTVSELDTRYSAANQTLTDALKLNTKDTQQLQTDLAKAQELILRQQDALTKLQASLDAQADALRQERNTRAAETSIRAQETSALRSRIRALEAKNEPYRP